MLNLLVYVLGELREDRFRSDKYNVTSFMIVPLPHQNMNFCKIRTNRHLDFPGTRSTLRDFDPEPDSRKL